MERATTIQQMSSARIPTDSGDFTLALYNNNHDNKEHLALIFGAIVKNTLPLVRIHSECFTGDTLGSLRCDCGPQLQLAMEQIAQEGAGIILYMRQEGRGIGLMEKLRAYSLQDEGYDTVEANLMLGHQADARDYTMAALILQDLGVQSVRLITNNPAKIEGLEKSGIGVEKRVAVETAVQPQNAHYLATKVERMRHLINLSIQPSSNGSLISDPIPSHLWQPKRLLKRPFVTLSFAQSLDGAITAKRGQPTPLSGAKAMKFTHQLRAAHDGILIGIGTMLADNPSLTVRLVNGRSPQPIVLDSHLRTPIQYKVQNPWIITTQQADSTREQALTATGATICRGATNKNGRIDLDALLTLLHQKGIHSLMVEGGAEIITSFLTEQQSNRLIVTIAPTFLGGLHSYAPLQQNQIQLQQPSHHSLENDVVMISDF